MIIALLILALCLGAAGVLLGYCWGTEDTMHDIAQLQARNTAAYESAMRDELVSQRAIRRGRKMLRWHTERVYPD